MKTLLLHYWLVNHRGGEKVLEVFSELFPDADILSHVYDEERFSHLFAPSKVHCTFINALPMASKLYQKYLPLMPLALNNVDVSEYDFLLSSESGPIKGVHKRPDAFHICYCHTPMRYVWDMYEQYRQNAGLISKAAMTLTRKYLRNYDLKSAEQVDRFIANSHFVAERIRKVYDRESTVIHPPVNFGFYSEQPRQEQDFYLYAGELCFYKRPDIVVDAFVKNGKKLVIAGCGNEAERLRRKAADHRNITFVGRVDDLQLRDLYRGCRAMIFPGIEDFGIMPLEAQAAGAPVIALGAGGALETVKDRVTGLFFAEQKVSSLQETLETFELMTFNPVTIRNHAAGFSRENFKQRISAFLDAELYGRK